MKKSDRDRAEMPLARRIVELAREFSRATTNRKRGEFIKIVPLCTEDNVTCVSFDTWNADWPGQYNAIEAVDNLAALLKAAGIRFDITDQPDGPAKDSSGRQRPWSNKPLLIATLSGTSHNLGKKFRALDAACEDMKEGQLPLAEFAAPPYGRVFNPL